MQRLSKFQIIFAVFTVIMMTEARLPADPDVDCSSGGYSRYTYFADHSLETIDRTGG
jgi:hypothetical protein